MSDKKMQTSMVLDPEDLNKLRELAATANLSLDGLLESLIEFAAFHIDHA